MDELTLSAVARTSDKIAISRRPLRPIPQLEFVGEADDVSYCSSDRSAIASLQDVRYVIGGLKLSQR